MASSRPAITKTTNPHDFGKLQVQRILENVKAVGLPILFHQIKASETAIAEAIQKDGLLNNDNDVNALMNALTYELDKTKLLGYMRRLGLNLDSIEDRLADNIIITRIIEKDSIPSI